MLGQVIDQLERFVAINDDEHQVTLTARQLLGTTLGRGLYRTVGAMNPCREEEGEGGVLEVQTEVP